MVYVDDVILAGKWFEENSWLIVLKDLGNLKYFLGIEVAQSRAGIHLLCRKYSLEILEDTGFLGAKPSMFPIEQNLKLNEANGELLEDPSL